MKTHPFNSACCTLQRRVQQSAPGCLLDILFILDASGSVQETFEQAKQLAVRFVEKLVIGPNNARVAAIRYAGRGKVRVSLHLLQPNCFS